MTIKEILIKMRLDPYPDPPLYQLVTTAFIWVCISILMFGGLLGCLVIAGWATTMMHTIIFGKAHDFTIWEHGLIGVAALFAGIAFEYLRRKLI